MSANPETGKPPFKFWYSERDAAELGCTHHAWMHGLMPCYVADPDGDCFVVLKSDLLGPIDTFLAYFYMLVCAASGNEPHFFCKVGREISCLPSRDR
ncbi:MAG: hypothetical protein LPL29_07635 [Alphaproteobacteria bacterium]|nr:hypothetical protein [Alphaproteobacteria bacterium]